ncbi:hypothetical protein XENOCAPTIV_023410 [Xenoophorus captivus]|uniref:Uncharacterized protein n=1 Tax=Xenoophorus captivus TaxID=1517983 RepID=A0ABV0QXA2_9TELE
MARSGSEFLPLLPRRNARLDSFLKRNTERALYERIRTYEPCVVVSDVINKVYMYAVLSDERVYLTEYPPRALNTAVSFARVRDIQLLFNGDQMHSFTMSLCDWVWFRFVQLGADGSPVCSAELGAPPGRDHRGEHVPAAAGAEDCCSPQHHTPETILEEYLDAACSLLFELLLLGFETSRCFPGDNFVSVSWILTVLQPHPYLVNVSSEESRCSALQILHLTSVCPLQLSFIRHQAQQLVQVLSDQHRSILSPVESVLLFQRCRLLLACLQYNNHLDQHLRLHFREEFRLETAVTCDPQSALPPSGKTKYYCRSISKRSPNSNSVT